MKKKFKQKFSKRRKELSRHSKYNNPGLISLQVQQMYFKEMNNVSKKKSTVIISKDEYAKKSKNFLKNL